MYGVWNSWVGRWREVGCKVREGEMKGKEEGEGGGEDEEDNKYEG
jgi:hypothetical protein